MVARVLDLEGVASLADLVVLLLQPESGDDLQWEKAGVLEVAEALYPERWTELRPRLVTVASWVGYDLDGRSDIRWTDTLRKRLIVHGDVHGYLTTSS